MKMFVSKKYLFVILLIVILLKPCSCYADNKDYVFKFDAVLASKLCMSPNNSSGCTVTCKDYSKAGPAVDPENRKFGGSGMNLYEECGSTDNYDTFYIISNNEYSTFNTDANFKNFLENSVCEGSSSCYGYVKENYCKNFSSSDSLCKKLKTLDGKSSEGTGQNGEKIQSCTASVIPLSGDDLLNSKLKFGIQVRLNTYPSGKQNLYIESVTKGDQSVSAQYLADEYMANVGDNNKFYFFAKGSDYSTFEKEYAKVFKDGVCPNITFCLNSFDGKDWYAELGGTCDPLKYETGVSQTTSDGSTSGLKLRETEPTPGKDLINGEILIGGCKALLGGDDDDSTLVDLLKTILTVVKIVVPIILLVMGSLDFARAIFSANEDEIKKSQSKFIRRLIVGVIIFLAPSILQEILTLAHSVWDVIDPTLCGILD